jgi:nucleoside-diphosphate-sugar epimerase
MTNAEDYDNWFAGRRILLTGGNGFLGRAIKVYAEERGAVVTPTDVSAHPASAAHLDVTSAESTVGCILEHQPEVIIHLAGVSHINESQAGPFRAFDVNVAGTLNVMRAAVKLKAKRLYPVHVVVASSNHVYGSHPVMSARTEESPLNQLDVYGASKHCADVLARSLGLASMIPTVALRHVNAYGPGGHPSHITTAACAAAIKGEPLALRGDGSARKSYLYVDDVAAAYLMLAKHAADRNVIGRAFNAAPAGPPLGVLAWVGVVNGIALDKGYQPKSPILKDPGKGEQPGYYEHLDASALRNCVGWWPRVSSDQGIGRLLDSLA